MTRPRIQLLRSMNDEIVLCIDGKPVGVTMLDPHKAGIVYAWMKTALSDIETVITRKFDDERREDR